VKIYTRTGDTGETALFAGGRVRKDDRLVEAYGTVDELNSAIGFARALGHMPARADGWLETVQNDLFVVGADLATPLTSSPAWLVRLAPEPAAALEAAIDTMDADLPVLKAFILPGGTPTAAALHIARTVCRRAERAAVAADGAGEGGAVNPHVIVYLNRLSDFLFTLARWTNHHAGEPETRWTART
jgi:cob(I)alamin adenosyltransferase